ncbi:TRAP transporter substrate-binding protein DctP [Amorphus orientalis]|uniref:TRAP-type C4-dicarboxylate transport system substrate-binding protein n=1 Tax=Amorphus orientalis TaxID=649198 RepID=A0AAE3VKC8_9HYPH|nr:TRAP transporter substrate-binding protein DctP [Amorphus orientalis]MDQ0313612.1 TRAP-type C4-dicarboxylate transport system substrate-binding protein [Amorphus orientalis]
MAFKTNRRTFLAGTAAAAGVLAMPAVLRAETIKLDISHYLPPTHGFEVDMLRPWAEELREKSDGQIDFEIHAANSALGKLPRQADQVRAGVTDVALGLAGIPRGRFPHTSIIELPFVVERAEAGSRALWELYQTNQLGGEYDDFKVLGLMTHHGALFHTVDRPIRELSDLKGLRIRSPGPAVNAMLEFEGASAIGMPPSQIYEALQKGAIDGVATTWDLVGAIKLNEVLKYHTDARVYAAAFYVVMNPRTYQNMPENLRTLIDETTGEAWQSKIGPWWDKWDAAGKQDAIDRGQEVIEISDAKRDEWRQQLEPMIDSYLESLKSEGVENPQELYEKTRELVQKYQS